MAPIIRYMKANQRKMRGYRDLVVWHKAMGLVPDVYRLIRKLPSEERFAMGDQLRRATISIPANIAEGQARCHPREFRQHLSIARGSLAEMDTLLAAAQSLGYLPEEALRPLHESIVDIRCMLFGLMRRLE